MGGIIVVTIPVVVVCAIAVSTVDSGVLGFNYDEVDGHDDRHNNQCNSGNSEGPNERSLVKRFGPSGCEIARIREVFLAGLWK